MDGEDVFNAGTQLVISAFTCQWWMKVIGLRLSFPINVPLNTLNIIGVEILNLWIKTVHSEMMEFPFGAALQAK
jgi:hypothetical protein